MDDLEIGDKKNLIEGLLTADDNQDLNDLTLNNNTYENEFLINKQVDENDF